MNIITIIQSALTALNNDAELFMLEKSRAENEELENTTDTIIVYPDWRTTNAFNQGIELSKTRVYNIDFKTPDEWDNSDNNAPTAYESKTSAERIEDMETLADSVFSYITNKNNLFPEITQKLKWTSPRPILRANNGTMSGVTVQLTVVFSGERVCDYIAVVPTPAPENVLSAVSYQDVLTEVGVLMAFIASKSINFGDSDPDEQLITDVEKTYNYTYLGRYDIDVSSLEADTTKLVFDHSKLIELNIDKLTGLTYLDLDTNNLPDFSISRFTELIYLDLSNNSISSAGVDEVLRLLDNFGKLNGTLLIESGNGARLASSNDYVRDLTHKGWFMEYGNILQCDVAGIAYTTQSDAYGLVFDAIMNRGAAANISQTYPIKDDTGDRTSGNGYEIQAYSNGSLYLNIITGGAIDANLMVTAISYLNANTDYRVLLWRNETINQYVTGAIGTFSMYIQGKGKPITTTKYTTPNLSDMELVTVSVGTNPVTNNTHITSLFMVTNLEAGDQTSKIYVNGKYISPYDFTANTGTYSVIDN